MNSSDFVIKDGCLDRYEGKERAVRIPDGVTRVDICAFGSQYRHCPVEKITVPASVTELAQSAFAFCTALTEIVFEGPIPKIPYGLFHGCRALRTLRLPSSVTRIEKEAFCGCTALEAIVLPEGLTEIGEGAFYGCEKLTRISFPASLQSLGASAFSGCHALYDVRAKEGLSEVGASAFSGCDAIAQIVLPASVTKIGDRAFAGCTSLAHVTLRAERVTLGMAVFDGAPSPLSVDFGGDAAAWEEMIRPIYVAPEYETMYGERGSYTKCYPLGHAKKAQFICHVHTEKDGRFIESYGHAATEDGGMMH